MVAALPSLIMWISGVERGHDSPILLPPHTIEKNVCLCVCVCSYVRARECMHSLNVMGIFQWHGRCIRKNSCGLCEYVS